MTLVEGKGGRHRFGQSEKLRCDTEPKASAYSVGLLELRWSFRALPS